MVLLIKLIIFIICIRNQFHDVLPGSSIEMVYDDSTAIYKSIVEKGIYIFFYFYY